MSYFSVTDGVTLYEHQKSCIDFVGELLTHQDYMGGIIADEMGLGKTSMYNNLFLSI